MCVNEREREKAQRQRRRRDLGFLQRNWILQEIGYFERNNF